jgi:hypothetical protein
MTTLIIIIEVEMISKELLMETTGMETDCQEMTSIQEDLMILVLMTETNKIMIAQATFLT